MLSKRHRALNLCLAKRPVGRCLGRVRHCIKNMELGSVRPARHNGIVATTKLIITTQIVIAGHNGHVNVYALSSHSKQLRIVLFASTLSGCRRLLRGSHVLVIDKRIDFSSFDNKLGVATHRIVSVSRTQRGCTHKLTVSLASERVSSRLLGQLHRSLRPRHSKAVPMRLCCRETSTHTQLHFNTA